MEQYLHHLYFILASTEVPTTMLRTSPPRNDKVVLYNPAARRVSPSPHTGGGGGGGRGVQIRKADVRSSYKVLPIVLGTGSFGTVRSCIHRQTRTKLAVKSVNVNGHSGNTELLKNEISLLQRLNHPHVVRMLDVLQDQTYVHIIMEHYTGKDLFDVIVGGKTPLSEGAGRRIIASLLDAIAYLHERNIVHRDLKVRVWVHAQCGYFHCHLSHPPIPFVKKADHIIFSGNDVNSAIKIIDFGVSTIHKPGDAPLTAFAGSVRSVAPEVVKRSYGRECDLWSTGVITFFLLTQQMPFNGGTSNDIFAKIVAGCFYYPQWAMTGLTEEAKDFINRLIVVDRRKRMTAEQGLYHPWIRRKKNMQPAPSRPSMVRRARTRSRQGVDEGR